MDLKKKIKRILDNNSKEESVDKIYKIFKQAEKKFLDYEVASTSEINRIINN